MSRYYTTRLGDSSAAQLSQYGPAQIMDAFNTLVDTFHSEQADYVGMVAWWNANRGTLTPEGNQQFAAGLQIQTEVVNGLQDSVSKFGAVLNNLGLSVSVPGLTGIRSRRLGVFPVAIAAVVIAIIAIVIGVGMYEYYQSQSQQAHELTEQAKQKTMQVAQTNVPALVQAGWSQQQIADYLKQQQDASQPDKKNLLDSIPWKTAIAGLVVYAGVKAVFG